jgi:hypothetical protein
MEWIMFLYTALLFFLLTPGILLTLPPKGKKMTVALVHALVFGVVFALSHKTIMRLSY